MWSSNSWREIPAPPDFLVTCMFVYISQVDFISCLSRLHELLLSRHICFQVLCAMALLQIGARKRDCQGRPGMSDASILPDNMTDVSAVDLAVHLGAPRTDFP